MFHRRSFSRSKVAVQESQILSRGKIDWRPRIPPNKGGAARGIRTPDPIITNPYNKLYRHPVLRALALLPFTAADKMRFAVEIFAPWMPKAETTGLIDDLLRIDPRRNWLTGKEAA